jgi:hypothetical protein
MAMQVSYMCIILHSCATLIAADFALTVVEQQLNLLAFSSLRSTAEYVQVCNFLAEINVLETQIVQ